MVSCENCGCEIPEEAKFCPDCGCEVIKEEPSSETKFCANCGCEMPRSTKFCPECGAQTQGNPQQNNTNNSVLNRNKDPLLAAVLSFLFIGLGQIYLGLTKKGILLIVGAIISGILMMILIGFITWFLIWGYAIFDAHKCAEMMNNGIAVEDDIDLHNLF